MFEISPSPVSAVIVTQAVMSVPAFVMKIFDPSTTHSPPSSVGGRARRTRVRSGVRLGQPERGERPARREVGQPLTPLLLGAEVVDRERAERVMRGDGDRDRRVDARQLLDRDRVRERVGAAAAVLLGDRHAHQPELCELGDELVREPLLAVELFGDRRDLLERELSNRVAHQLVFALDVEVHAGALSSARIGGRWYRGARRRCVETPFRGMSRTLARADGLRRHDVCGA